MKRKKGKRKLLAFLLLLVLGAAAGLHYAVRVERYQGFGAPVLIDIPRGTSTMRIGELLAEQGVVRHPWLFVLARLRNPRTGPQAGEYLFQRPATPMEVYLRMARGDVFLIEITVPEGSNVFDIGRIVEQAGLTTSREMVLAGLSEEGYLFPSTYRFPRKATAKDVVQTMRRQFTKVWGEIGGDAPMKKTVTLASMVEREAKLPEERKRIAGVFENRLEKGMPLQCDPTVVYAALLDKEWRGEIHRSDLERNHPYNTYRKPGLPPGPIANPGRAALEAVLDPAQTDDLYFVAAPDRSGAHVFSKEYTAHERAVVKYRNGQQKAADPRPARRNRSGKR